MDRWNILPLTQWNGTEVVTKFLSDAPPVLTGPLLTLFIKKAFLILVQALAIFERPFLLAHLSLFWYTQ